LASGYVVYGLRETYAELGKYEFRIVLDPKQYSDGHDSTLSIVDSDGTIMSFDVRKWGRKLNCSFEIREDTADGVASISLQLVADDGTVNRSRLTMWIIKP
jgi:hypothetical protein